MMKLKFQALLLTLTIFLSSCHAITVVTEPLPIPEPLVMPVEFKIQNSEWDCITSNRVTRVECSAFQKLGKQMKLRDKRIDTLMGVIKSTHK